MTTKIFQLQSCIFDFISLQCLFSIPCRAMLSLISLSASLLRPLLDVYKQSYNLQSLEDPVPILNNIHFTL